MRLTLKFKLMAGGITLLLVPLFCTSIFSIYSTSKAVEELSWQQIGNLTDDLSGMVNIIITENLNTASALATGNTIVKAAQAVQDSGITAASLQLTKLNAKLNEKHNRIGQYFFAMMGTDADGRVIGASDGFDLVAKNFGKYDFIKLTSTGAIQSDKV